MFTGIVEEVGIIKSMGRSANSISIAVEAKEVLSGTKVGDSIAVNGVCLTVTELTGTGFSADVMNETLAKSSLGKMTSGGKVNLERALAADGRFGGHIVSGHIDGTGAITGIKNDGNAIWFTIRTSSDIMKYIIKKGSIAIDGISLTVAELTDTEFKVSVIPHTMSNTCLTEKKVGAIVNLENDCIGKYVEKLIVGNSGKEKELTRDFLIQNGF